MGLRPIEVTRVIEAQQAEITELKGRVETMQAALTELDELRDRLDTLLATQVASNAR